MAGGPSDSGMGQRSVDIRSIGVVEVTNVDTACRVIPEMEWLKLKGMIAGTLTKRNPSYKISSQAIHRSMA